MTLGELLAAWQDDAVILDALIGLDDLALLARLKAAAEEDGSDLATVVREEVGRFVQLADDETWLMLMGRLAKAEDPAKVGLKVRRRDMNSTRRGLPPSASQNGASPVLVRWVRFGSTRVRGGNRPWQPLLSKFAAIADRRY